jgi:hypothetical protein
MGSIVWYWKIVFALGLSFAAGCVVVDRPPKREVVVVETDKHGPPPWAPAHGWRRKHETYHYYPAIQVYYYPSVRKYYWVERGNWKSGGRLPAHYVVERHKKIVIDLDDEPHKHHHKIKMDYPPDYFDRRRG